MATPKGGVEIANGFRATPGSLDDGGCAPVSLSTLAHAERSLGR